MSALWLYFYCNSFETLLKLGNLIVSRSSILGTLILGLNFEAALKLGEPYRVWSKYTWSIDTGFKF